jgi:hypothetical protein
VLDIGFIEDDSLVVLLSFSPQSNIPKETMSIASKMQERLAKEPFNPYNPEGFYLTKIKMCKLPDNSGWVTGKQKGLYITELDYDSLDAYAEGNFKSKVPDRIMALCKMLLAIRMVAEHDVTPEDFEEVFPNENNWLFDDSIITRYDDNLTLEALNSQDDQELSSGYLMASAPSHDHLKEHVRNVVSEAIRISGYKIEKGSVKITCINDDGTKNIFQSPVSDSFVRYALGVPPFDYDMNGNKVWK